MVMNVGLYSYLGAAVAYGFFMVLLLSSLRTSQQGRRLALVIAISAAWAVLAALTASQGIAWVEAYNVFEILRYLAWYIFLLRLFDKATGAGEGYHRFARVALPSSLGFGCLVLLDELTGLSGQPLLALIGHIFMALIGLAIIEQLYRNTAIRHRWAVKYLFIGCGGLFAYDFFLYVDTLLFRGLDQTLWEARGIVNVFVVPLLMIASVRNKNWELNVFVSRDIVLTTTAIVGGGIYLLVMAGAGYYLREFGGSWSLIGQVVLFSLAMLLLASLVSSRQLRSQVRVFLGKHFYRNKYDYRVEWSRLTDKLNESSKREERFRAAIEAMASTVEAREGMLWLLDEQSCYNNVVSWNGIRLDLKITAEQPLIRFFEDKGFVININEIESRSDEYGGLQLPEWLAQLKRPWLIVPLFNSSVLIGFVVLANPLIMRSINWEDRDLLITAAKQVTSYLMVVMTSDALAEAKQFEVFTRLSAYMVHDLKNIAAELELVSRNAKKHINNPDFIDDAFDTVDNAAGDINRLLDQLRNRRAQTEKRVMIDLAGLLSRVVEAKQDKQPSPALTVACSSCLVTAEENRLANVVAHLIENAQQATGVDGRVEVSLRCQDAMQIVEISDNGVGMDADFVRNRLFKPFDTTKGNAGMGIGMYESREFIRQLGGDIRVQSEVGKGTMISLHIPAAGQQTGLSATNA